MKKLENQSNQSGERELLILDAVPCLGDGCQHRRSECGPAGIYISRTSETANTTEEMDLLVTLKYIIKSKIYAT